MLNNLSFHRVGTVSAVARTSASGTYWVEVTLTGQPSGTGQPGTTMTLTLFVSDPLYARLLADGINGAAVEHAAALAFPELEAAA